MKANLRAALVKYCGRQLNKHAVVWYDHTLSKIMDAYFNTGDICVYDSTLQLLDYDVGSYLNIDAPVNSEEVARVKAKCDFILLRGSNYIHDE